MKLIKDLIMDPKFLAVGSKGGFSKRSSILITTPYVEAANRWRRPRDDLLKRLDRTPMRSRIHRDVETEVRTQGTISGCEYDLVINDMVNQNLTTHMEVSNKWSCRLDASDSGEFIIMHPAMKKSPRPKLQGWVHHWQGVQADLRVQDVPKLYGS